MALAPAVAALTALSLAGCAAAGAEPSAGADAGTNPPPSSAPAATPGVGTPGAGAGGPGAGGADRTRTELLITMLEVGGTTEHSTFTLTCDPVGGDLPTALVACDRLASGGDPFAPVAPGASCLDVIQGPGLIAVKGRWEGRTIGTQFSQIDSCESARFTGLLDALGFSSPGPG